MGSLLSFSVIVSALELGFIYALVALALFLSYSILNIADLSTDGCFTLGCGGAVCSDGSRRVLWLHYGVFTDEAWCRINPCGNHC